MLPPDTVNDDLITLVLCEFIVDLYLHLLLLEMFFQLEGFLPFLLNLRFLHLLFLLLLGVLRNRGFEHLYLLMVHLEVVL